MKNKILTLIVFICSLAALCISLKLFWNVGIYVDESGTSPAAVFGGEFWLIMHWLKLLLLAVSTLVSGIKLFFKE